MEGFDRGYTGHEHLSAFEVAEGFTLINMNGRVYDPVLARFLSPDPYVQAPDFTQSFNRYTYCLNNPFKYTDPNGESIIAAIAIGAAIGAYTGGVMANNGQANPEHWNYSSGDTWGYMAGGGVIGGLSGWAGGAAGGLVGNAFSAPTTFWGAVGQGSTVGFVSGATGGFISGAGNAWLGGSSFGEGLRYGLIGGGIGGITGGLIGGISGGIQYQKEEFLFRAAENEMGFESGKPIPANDENLNRFTDYWYKSRNKAPFDNLIDYTYDNKTAKVIEYLKTNSEATAVTMAQFGLNGKSTGFSSIYFSNKAFASSRTLYLAIGHELVHVQQYAYLAGSTGAFLKSAKAVMEVGAYSWEYTVGRKFAMFDIKSWQTQSIYGSFINSNTSTAYHLMYNCTVGLPAIIPNFGTIPIPIPYIKTR